MSSLCCRTRAQAHTDDVKPSALTGRQRACLTDSRLGRCVADGSKSLRTLDNSIAALRDI